MSPRRCPVAGCGRFITAEAAHCARHASADRVDDDVLGEELGALRYVLGRLLEIDDVDMLAKHIPRVSSVAIQAARARHQIGERGRDDLMTFLGPILKELDEETLS